MHYGMKKIVLYSGEVIFYACKRPYWFPLWTHMSNEVSTEEEAWEILKKKKYCIYLREPFVVLMILSYVFTTISAVLLAAWLVKIYLPGVSHG